MEQLCFDFSGSSYVVTGASSGIGKAITLAIAKAGGRVLAIARREVLLREVQDFYPERIAIAAVDVRATQDVAMAVQSFAAEQKLAGVVHAAGLNFFMPLRALQREKAGELMDTSFWAALELLKITTKKNYSHDGASYVALTSVAASIGQPGFAVYGAAKNAMISASKTLALEVAKRRLRINTVSPGWIPTEVSIEIEKQVGQSIEETAREYPLGIGKIEDVVSTVMFLLSDQARWITGTNITVDGGYSAGK